MANLRAPSSEASSTYNSLSKNNKLNEAYDFVIPYFDNMPETTYDSKFKDIELKRLMMLVMKSLKK